MGQVIVTPNCSLILVIIMVVGVTQCFVFNSYLFIICYLYFYDVIFVVLASGLSPCVFSVFQVACIFSLSLTVTSASLWIVSCFLLYFVSPSPVCGLSSFASPLDDTISFKGPKIQLLCLVLLQNQEIKIF